VRVQRGEQTRSAGAENQDVGAQTPDWHRRVLQALTFSAASATARRSRAA